MSDLKLCPKCEGNGSLRIRNGVSVCEPCGGTGIASRDDEVASLRAELSRVRANLASCEAAFARWKEETAKDVAALEDMRVQRDVRQNYGDRMKDERDALLERLKKYEAGPVMQDFRALEAEVEALKKERAENESENQKYCVGLVTERIAALARAEAAEEELAALNLTLDTWDPSGDVARKVQAVSAEALEARTLRARLEVVTGALLDTRKGDDEGPCWCPSPTWRNAPHRKDGKVGEHCDRPGQNCKMYRAALKETP